MMCKVEDHSLKVKSSLKVNLLLSAKGIKTETQFENCHAPMTTDTCPEVVIRISSIDSSL